MTDKVMTQAPLAPKTFVDYVLPPSIVSKKDISHIVTEMEHVDAEATAAAVRAKSNVASPSIAPLSQQLTDFLVANKLRLDDARSRSEIIKHLRLLKDKAPVIHMTFASSADPESVQYLVQWLRSSVSPQIVITVGKQPALVAGVYMRTPNRVHDLSLRAKLEANRGLLLKELEKLHG